MSLSQNTVRLYRAMDVKNSLIITSKITNRLNTHSMNEEIVSHELCSKTKRGVLYSFTTDLATAKDYAKHYNNSKICFVDISLSEPLKSVIELIPLFDRTLWLNRMALDDILLKEKILVNPATGRKHTVVGLTNYSSRTACGWASALSEVMIQASGLELKKLSDMSDNVSSEETERLLLKYYLKELPDTSIRTLRSLVNEQFENGNLKMGSLLKLVSGDSWYNQPEHG